MYFVLYDPMVFHSFCISKYNFILFAIDVIYFLPEKFSLISVHRFQDKFKKKIFIKILENESSINALLNNFKIIF